MFHTNRETTERTITRLIRALDRHQPVTITYTKADGSQTIRTIELTDITVTKAGDTLLKAMDRDSQELRSFRVDRIQAYTVHTGASYQVPVHAPAASGHGITAAAPRVARLTPATRTLTDRVNTLADLLTA